MEEQIIKYKHWKTGKDCIYELNKSYNEGITKLICPFDQTPLVFGFTDTLDILECINCGDHYSGKTQKEIDRYAKRINTNNQKVLKELDKKRKDLATRVEHAESIGIIPKEK